MSDSKILNDLLRSTKSLLGNGPAWLIQAVDIQNVLKSFLNIPELAREYFLSVASMAFPAKQYGKIPNDQLEKNIRQWERQFGLSPAQSASLLERATAVEAQWSLTGSIGLGYLQDIINNSGVPVYLRENIPAVDYSGDLLGLSYGSFDYNQYLPAQGYIVNYNTGGGSFLLGNGFLTSQGGTSGDIVVTPTTMSEWQSVILVEGETFGSTATLTAQQYNLFLQLFLRYKRMDSIALCRIQIS